MDFPMRSTVCEICFSIINLTILSQILAASSRIDESSSNLSGSLISNPLTLHCKTPNYFYISSHFLIWFPPGSYQELNVGLFFTFERTWVLARRSLSSLNSSTNFKKKVFNKLSDQKPNQSGRLSKILYI